jgi:hypothetical protein
VVRERVGAQTAVSAGAGGSWGALGIAQMRVCGLRDGPRRRSGQEDVNSCLR